jgi:hypothetical protein
MTGVSPVNDVMTLAETEAAFPSEWVLMADPVTDASLQVESGHTLWHSKDRDEVYRKAIEAPSKYVTVLYTGTMPEGTAIVL